MGTEKFGILEQATEHSKTCYEALGNKFNSKKSTVATSLMSEQPEDKNQARHKRKASGIPTVPQGSNGTARCNIQRGAKATITTNRIGTIRSIFTSEQGEHLITAAGLTQYALGRRLAPL